jgi:hypothetical protein
LIDLYKRSGPDFLLILSDIGMLQMCRPNGQAGSMGRAQRVGFVQVALLQALFVTIVHIKQARAGGIRLDALQGVRFGRRENRI